MKLAVLCLALTLQVCAVTIGQVETFDSAHQWVIGVGPGPADPMAVPTQSSGGPAGAGDAFLMLSSSGLPGPGGRLTAQNFGIWSGDYISAGVGRIRMDVRNFGGSDLVLRLLFVHLEPGPLDVALTTTGIPVAAGGDWETIEFDVSAAALTAILGTAEGALANATEMRIFHNTAAAFPTAAGGGIPLIAAQLGVDNITAVPEPGSLTLVAAAGLIVVLSRRRLYA